jgi:hypothetical protein
MTNNFFRIIIPYSFHSIATPFIFTSPCLISPNYCFYFIYSILRVHFIKFIQKYIIKNKTEDSQCTCTNSDSRFLISCHNVQIWQFNGYFLPKATIVVTWDIQA